MTYRSWRGLRIRSDFIVSFTALLVGIHGAFFIATTLVDQLAAHRVSGSTFSVDLPLLIGLSLMYLSSRLVRRKHIAWMVALLSYAFVFAVVTLPFLANVLHHQGDIDRWVRAVALPVLVVLLLVLERRQFVVRSDVAVFRSSLRFSIIILLVAFFYGTAGFLLLDTHDFHRELSVGAAMHYTIDQFDLTTNHPLRPHTRRARIFVDSLSAVSIVSIAYAGISLFAPLRAKLHNRAPERRQMAHLLTKYGAPSEDFFKLWPQDKQYYFNAQASAGIAYKVCRGVALCLADPVGDKKALTALLKSFDQLCHLNDWLPAFIHTEPTYKKLYEQQGYELQLIGQEAAVDTAHYESSVRNKKYFRNIRNRFEREGYKAELLQPPHADDVIERLTAISDEWLGRPGRTERGFVMGYFTAQYMQQCTLLVARDATGTIQGFMNQVPAPFDTVEATYDMLRQTDDSLGNTNDFLLTNFIETMGAQGYKRINLGLSPLVGLDEKSDDKRSGVDNFLRFAYANGDRFYSFSGLHRFKAKYEPEWRDRFVVYRGGVAGFARIMTALLKAMQVRKG